MKKYIEKILAVLITTVLSVTIVLSFALGVKKYPEPALTKISDGVSDASFYCISDFKNSTNLLRYAYYTPDEFVNPSGENSPQGTLVDLNGHNPAAKRGTYQFYILNLDPADKDFAQKKEELSPYLEDDNYWHFVLKLPTCFSACCVYVKSVLTARSGDIENYDYIKYSDKAGFSEKHVSETKQILLDLSFYTRREGIPADFLRRALTVTVHYEADNGFLAGYNNMPAIGESEVIENNVNNDKVFLTFLSLASALVFAILAFACVLKNSLFMLPQVLIAAGICGFSLFSMIMLSGTHAPYLIYAMIYVSAALLLVAAILSLVYAFRQHKTEFLIAPPVIITFTLSFPFIPLTTPVMLTPTVWLIAAALCITVVSAFKFFAELERRNIYLTNNLQSEVAYQTSALNNIIDEHDSLLRYLSHDMKKPITSVKKFIAEIRRHETDEENMKALGVIEKKINDIESNISELQKYSKTNFTAEERTVVNANELIQSVCTALQPDCEANGILLNFTRNRLNIQVFAKPNALYSVLSNLIFNAIEHSDCKNIYIGLRKEKSECKINVTDDGKGIENAEGIFTPYTADGNGEQNLGLGLYICKQHMASMGGDLDYERKGDDTVFTATLPLA